MTENELFGNSEQLGSKTRDKRTETHACDLIDRQAAIETVRKAKSLGQAHRMLVQLPFEQPGWIPCTPETMPPDYQWYYATCKSLVDNRENWVVEGCYTPWEHFDSTPMIKCGDAEVIAWMPKEFPEPWKGEEDVTSRAVLSQKPVR